MFPSSLSLTSLQAAVAHKREIRFVTHPNGITVGCYLFSDNQTFDSPESLECRGIAFDAEGRVVSRPLHKFFNLGERSPLTEETLRSRTDIAAIYDKLDGSMIATALINGRLHWRSKKSFDSDVVHLTQTFTNDPRVLPIHDFATEVAFRGLTAIFELTHPAARIVVSHDRPALRLLHVRDNQTGQYVMLDPSHPIHELIADYAVPLVPRHEIHSLDTLLASLPTLSNHEGYVIQFSNGDMVKVKCPWYVRLHRSLTFLRERDIASLALHGEIDDLKQTLREVAFPLEEVDAIEQRLATHLRSFIQTVDEIYQADQALDRKSFAIRHRAHPLFSLLMSRYQGHPLDLVGYYKRHHLDREFSLRTLGTDALADALQG